MVALKPKPAAVAEEKPKKKGKPVDDDEDEPRPKAKAKPRYDDDEEEAPRPKTKAKSRAADDEDEEDMPRPKAKTKSKLAADDDEEDERPKTKAKSKPAARKRDEDDEDDGADEESLMQDGSVARRMGLDPGFKDAELMEQVEKELKSGETLYWAGRQHMPVIQKHAIGVALGGLVFAIIGAVVTAIMMSQKDLKMPITLIPLLFVLVGILIMIFGPIMKIRQGKLGWYAITDQRAVVFEPYAFGTSGKVTNYGPNQLARFRLMKTFWSKTAGSLVFKTMIKLTTTTTTHRRGPSTSSTSTQTTHYGFLYIEDYKDVAAVLKEALFGDTSGGDADEMDYDEM